MIKTATQLKAKVRNLSGNDGEKAQMLIRNYIMERFLERLTLSDYRDCFILKGGMLVSSMVGINSRATKDIDTSVKALELSRENIVSVIEKIIASDIGDEVRFAITKVDDIMEENDCSGIRITLEATLDRLKQTMKIDISTGDVITPKPVEYSYDLMFEDRSISLLAYNAETLLAEKLETIVSRGVANTRMRDFYDIHVICRYKKFDTELLKQAFSATCKKRNTVRPIDDIDNIMFALKTDEEMEKLWNNFREDSFFRRST